MDFLIHFLMNYEITFTGPGAIIMTLIWLYFLAYTLFHIFLFLYRSTKWTWKRIFGAYRGRA